MKSEMSRINREFWVLVLEQERRLSTFLLSCAREQRLRLSKALLSNLPFKMQIKCGIRSKIQDG
jgi:hypothetical protein